MTRQTDLERLKQLLTARRKSIGEAQGQAREELRALKEQERDPEYEEGAQSELADYTLSHLIENARRELLMIDAAFERMEEGSYGECLDCGDDIPLERLEALPFALRCEEDARLHERSLSGGRDITPSL